MSFVPAPGLIGRMACIVLLLAGLWRRDCVLLASAPVVAQRAFMLDMDWGSPWRPLQAATRAITAGVLGLLIAPALVVHVMGVQLGWWWVAREPDSWAPAWILAAAVLLVALQRHRSLMLGESLFWLAMLAAASAASGPWTPLPIEAACAFVLVAAATTAWSAWRLAARSGPWLLREAG